MRSFRCHRTDYSRRTTKPFGIAGYSTVELCASLVVLAVLAKLAVPSMNSGKMQIFNAQKMVIAGLRLARSNAITHNVHYQIEIPSTDRFLLEPMIQTNGVWGIDTTKTTQTTLLPSPTSFPSAMVGIKIQFNSRGEPVNMNAVQQINVTDTFNQTMSLQTWPSGQVNAL